MNYMELSQKAYTNAIEHGFHFENTTENLVDAIGELYEAKDHIRQWGLDAWFNRNPHKKWLTDLVAIEPDTYEKYLSNLADTEIADCIIRLLAMCGAEKYQFESKIANRIIKNDSLRLNSFDDILLYAQKFLSTSKVDMDFLYGVIGALEEWCDRNDVGIDFFVRVKMEYNKTREYRHGRK